MQSTLREMFDLDVPLVLAPFGPWDQVELAAAVCRAGGLGSVGTAVRSTDELRAQWARLRDLTDRPFVINHTGRPFNAEAFKASLDFGPAAWIVPRDSTTGVSVQYAPPSMTKSMSIASSRPSRAIAVRCRVLDGCRFVVAAMSSARS